MGKYVPTAITYAESGLVKDRDAFVLADDAYQELENIWQWRGRLRRRRGYDLLGRLRRNLTAQALVPVNADSTNDYNAADILAAVRVKGGPSYLDETNASLAKSSVVIIVDAAGDDVQFTDDGTGHLSRTSGTAFNLYAAQTITAMTAAVSAVITIGAHQFAVGNKVLIESVVGMAEANDTVVTVTAFDATTITVGLNTFSFTTYSSGGTVNGSYLHYDSGEVNLTFDTAALPGVVPVTADYGYYPCLPTMGLPNRELDALNAEQTIAFDTIYGYQYNNTSNQFQEITVTPPAVAPTWNGLDSDFFWSTNYWQSADNRQYYWTTNYNAIQATPDPIRVYDGTFWFDFLPALDGAPNDFLQQTRMLIPYKGRLVALNTYEGALLAGSTQFAQRARWSQNGAPFQSVNAGNVPTFTDEWRSDVKGRGGFVDAPTNEHIVSAQFIRDLLVVGFESSTWALRYTGNEILPFVWDRINVELGSESTFSMVAFDKGLLFVGDKSINSCNGNNVERIDEDIPDEVFNIHNSFDPSTDVSDGPLRVHGKRDFFERVVYWTFPNASTEAKFPDRVLLFNYHNQTWAIFTDSFTCFGEYMRFNDVTWATVGGTWATADFTWITAKLQSQFPNIIAGNQHGFVLNLNTGVDNSESLHITAVAGGTTMVLLTVPNHNLQTGEFVKVTGILGTGGLELNSRIFYVERNPADKLNQLFLWEKPRTTITNITQATEAVITCTGHNFGVGQHFFVDSIASGSMTKMNGLNGLIRAVSQDGTTVTVDIDTTVSGFAAYVAGSGGAIQNLDANKVGAVVQARTYLGCGVLARVMGFSARSKKFNLLQVGSKNFLGHVDFLADVTEDGEVACQIFTDYVDSAPINDNNDDFFNTVFSTQAEQFSQPDKSKEWHRFYCTTNAQFFEYNLMLNERQMFTPAIVNSNVQIDSMIIWSEGGGRLVD